MPEYNLLTIVSLAALLVSAAILFLLLRRGRTYSDDTASASRYQALAEERQTEIDRLNVTLSDLRSRLEREAEERQQLTNTITRVETERKAERKAAEEKIQMLTEIREDMESKFKEVTQESLKTQGESMTKTNLEKIEAALKPLKEHVGRFQLELKTVHEETLKERERLKVEIEQLSERSERISEEAVALTRALKSDKQRQGAWGEMVLESILQGSGLREGEEYVLQAHRTGSEGERLRPDAVVRLPGGKTLVIDSKVSLVAYAEATAAEDEEEAAAARKRHVQSMLNHIRSLASKEYQSAESASVDYVIMFVPIEGAISEALRQDGSITDHALERNVMIATPTTLMMALKTVANVWAVERRNQNAEAIAKRAGLLYDKITGFIDNMKSLGSRLDQAQAAYRSAFDQLSRGRGNLLFHVESLKKLGARTTKSIDVEYDADDDSADRLELSSGSGEKDGT